MTERSERRRLKKRVLALLNARLCGTGVRFEQHGGKCVLVSGKWHHVAGMEWESVETAFIDEPNGKTVQQYFRDTFEVLKCLKPNQVHLVKPLSKKDAYGLFGPVADALRPFVGCRSPEELELRLEAFS